VRGGLESDLVPSASMKRQIAPGGAPCRGRGFVSAPTAPSGTGLSLCGEANWRRPPVCEQRPDRHKR
jgi:hypothetical protein